MSEKKDKIASEPLYIVEYEGKDEQDRVFDTTKGEVGKAMYGVKDVVPVFLDKMALLPGLKKTIKECKKGESKEVVLKPEEAYGEHNPKLVRVLKLSAFGKDAARLRQGAWIEFETPSGPIKGLVKSVGNGRVRIDFNHPLAGKTVKYTVKVVDIINDPDKQLEYIATNLFDAHAKRNDGTVEIELSRKLEEPQRNVLRYWVHLIMPDMKVEFKQPKEEKSQKKDKE